MKLRASVTVTTVFVALCIVAGLLAFAAFVHDSLWEKSVTDILEVTTQGQNALDTYFEKDLDTLDLFADELAAQSSSDAEIIDEKIALFDGNDSESTYLCVDLETGEVRRTSSGDHAVTITEEQFAEIERHAERGVQDPFLDEATGVKSIGVYEKFTFADGVPGLVRKSKPLQEVADRYSLSFFANQGFSYVVNAGGDIAIRSAHRNSNRTITSIYDIVDEEGNDSEVIQSFRLALEQGKSGVALFTYLGEDYVFCYAPLGSTDGWDLVSVIPNNVVMEQANTILKATFALCAAVLVGSVIVLAMYWRTSSTHRREIERMAYFDKLTGLYSSSKFELEGNAQLNAWRERSRRFVASADATGHRAASGFAVAYLNIADFKLINDVDGYRRGDEVLCEVAAILKDVCGGDGFASRTAADHFIVFCSCGKPADMVARCREIVKRAEGIIAAGRPLSLHVGVCCSEDSPDAAVNELTDRARMAKTEGRQTGESVCMFNASMRDAMLRKADIEAAMEAALAAGEFFPMIQPKFSTDGARVLGGEALVRWNRPGEGVVGPIEFIPLFEQNGFVLELDEYVFRAVCRDLKTWIDEGKPVVPISINVSRLHLYQADFVARYIGIKDEYGIPDGIVELEFTESMVLEDMDSAIDVIDRLRAAGFGCSIDDFGSGESSLNALKDLPADVLKLDRAFLFDRTASDKGKVVVKTIIDMAQKLEMKTVMEGVETSEQLSFIQTTSCDMVQGFVFSKPLAVEEFYRLLDDGR